MYANNRFKTLDARLEVSIQHLDGLINLLLLQARFLHVSSQRVGSLELRMTPIASHRRRFAALVLHVAPQVVGIFVDAAAVQAHQLLVAGGGRALMMMVWISFGFGVYVVCGGGMI